MELRPPSRSKGWAACKYLSNESLPTDWWGWFVCIHARLQVARGRGWEMTAYPSSLPKAMWTKGIIESHSSNQTHRFLAFIMSIDSVATALSCVKHSGSHTWTCNLRVLDRLRHYPWRTHEFKQLQLAQIMTVTTCLLTYGQYSRLMHYELKIREHHCRFRWGWIEVH